MYQFSHQSEDDTNAARSCIYLEGTDTVYHRQQSSVSHIPTSHKVGPRNRPHQLQGRAPHLGGGTSADQLVNSQNIN